MVFRPGSTLPSQKYSDLNTRLRSPLHSESRYFLCPGLPLASSFQSISQTKNVSRYSYPSVSWATCCQVKASLFSASRDSPPPAHTPTLLAAPHPGSTLTNVPFRPKPATPQSSSTVLARHVLAREALLSHLSLNLPPHGSSTYKHGAQIHSISQISSHFPRNYVPSLGFYSYSCASDDICPFLSPLDS